MMRKIWNTCCLVLGFLITFLLYYGTSFLSEQIEYTDFIEKLNANELSRIVVEANEYRAFVYPKEGDEIYMVKMLSFEETEKEIFKKISEDPSLKYDVDNAEKISWFRFIVLSLCYMNVIRMIGNGLAKLFTNLINFIYRKIKKTRSKKNTDDDDKVEVVDESSSNKEKSKSNSKKSDQYPSEKDIDDLFNRLSDSIDDNRFVPRAITGIKTRFSDVIGLENQVEELNDIVSFLKEPEKYRQMGAEIPKGVLLFGKPGTGKTLIARAIAGEAGVPFFSVSASQVQSEFVGGSEKNIRKLFKAAKKKAPAIIFFDELDSIAVQRYSEASNKYAASILNQLLACMDGFEQSSGVIVIAATNYKDVLDQALLRRGRFDRQIYIHEPDKKAREELVRYYMRDKVQEEADFEEKLADLMTGATGSDIKTVINEAAILAVRNNRTSITIEDAYEAYRKIILGVKGSNIEKTLKDKKITAIHEAGHALVARRLGKTPVEISIISRGDAGGYNLFKNRENSYFTQQDLLDEVKISLGGRAAEKIIFGEISTGASGDLRNASEILFKMNLVYGMSSDVQLVLIDNDKYNTNITNGAVKSMESDLEQCFSETKTIIEEHQDVLKELANLLLEAETLNVEDVTLFFEHAGL